MTVPPAVPPPPHGHHTRLDAYADRYATRTRGMTASEIRALFSVASRPEVVSLAGGMPSLTSLPMDAVADSVHDLVRTRGATALQYGSGQGDPVLREQICEVMAAEGIDGHPDDVVVTVGSQQGLDLVTRIFCDPGDVVVCEAPSYVGALGVFRAYECDVVHVEMDDEGLVPEALAAGAHPARGGRSAGQVLLHRADLPQPGRRDTDSTTAGRGAGHLRRARRAGRRGQSLWPVGIRG